MSFFEISILVAIVVLISRLKSFNVVFSEAPIWEKFTKRGVVVEPSIGDGEMMDGAEAQRLAAAPERPSRIKQARQPAKRGRG